MATTAQTVGATTKMRWRSSDDRFFLVSAILMAAVLVAGFSLQLASGRSSFAVPARFHIHALLFFGWIVLYVVQASLATTGSLALHRRLGWVASLWVPAMVCAAIYLTAANVHEGRSPPFFQPASFLVMNTLHVLCFAGLVAAALVRRRDTAWHRRFMFCSMAMLLGPGFGRLLPMPLLIPWGGWAVVVAALLFPLAGVIRDLRRNRRVHPAWWWGTGAMLGTQLLVDPIARSGIGLALYAAVTAGSPTALPALDFPMLSRP
ncbi:MAG: hypothetical protein ABW278_01320 [Steroidobacteraceae bacterium]